MAAVTVQVPQAEALVTTFSTAGNLNVPQSQLLVTYNMPAENMTATYGGVGVAYNKTAADINVVQAQVLAVVRGRISNPKLRAWTFDLDGHEFYVLSLGNGKTLVYDLSTNTWSWWATSTFDYWRANIGTNWVENGQNAFLKGSNVVVGDDSANILWMLNPKQGYDDVSDATGREEGKVAPFERIATGQVLTRGRETIPCYQVYAVADVGNPGYTGATVTLSYSDNQGLDFVSAGSIESVADNYLQEFAWRSLGLVRAPGRIFRITDDGAFPKLNELSIADVNTAS